MFGKLRLKVVKMVKRVIQTCQDNAMQCSKRLVM